MIRFSADNGKEIIVGIGLSRGNIDLLTQKKPIFFGLDEVGIPTNIKITIFFGETESEMADELMEMGFVDEETKVHITPEAAAALVEEGKKNSH